MSVHTFIPGFEANILIILVPVICLVGIILLLRRWGHGNALDFLSTWKAEAFRLGFISFTRTLVLDVLLFHRVWNRSKWRWASHMVIFWTFTVFWGAFTVFSLLGFIAAFVDPNGWGGMWGGMAAQSLEPLHLPCDLLSYVLLAAGLFVLLRRLVISKVRERTGRTDYFIILCVIIISITGIVAEVYSGYASFIGEAFLDWNAALRILQLHIYAVFLLFIMLIPWTRFKHIITVPILLLARRGGE
jgi:nitrate reductase gamma subunit